MKSTRLQEIIVKLRKETLQDEKTMSLIKNLFKGMLEEEVKEMVEGVIIEMYNFILAKDLDIEEYALTGINIFFDKALKELLANQEQELGGASHGQA